MNIAPKPSTRKITSNLGEIEEVDGSAYKSTAWSIIKWGKIINGNNKYACIDCLNKQPVHAVVNIGTDKSPTGLLSHIKTYHSSVYESYTENALKKGGSSQNTPVTKQGTMLQFFSSDEDKRAAAIIDKK